MGTLIRLWRAFDDRTGTSRLIGPVLSHPVPKAIGLIGWSYALGSAVLTAFILQVVTGIALATAYIPSTGDAFASLQFITDQATFGSLLRGMHNYGAWAMIIAIGLHMAQVFLVGAYKYPREVNWLSGVVLLVLTLAMGFTGQLLRWDQIAYWSVFVLAQQVARTPFVGPALAEFVLAGATVNGATLSRFYAFHVFFIPALIFAMVALHVWLVVHTGVSEPPRPGRPVDPATYRAWYQRLVEREGVPFWPDAAWRDVVLGVAMIVVIMIVSLVVGPPHLEAPPDPTAIEAYPRPDWYLTWIFAALALLPPEWEDILLLGVPALFGLLMLALPFFANRGERSPRRRPWAVAIVLVALLMIGTLYVAGERAPWSPRFDARLEAAALGVTDPTHARGLRLYNDQGCVTCHAIGGVGGQRGPDLSTVGSRLTREHLIIRILAGGRNMPAYAGSLTPEEVEALVAFLAARQGSGVGAGTGNPPGSGGGTGP
jgi:ubiquinol-cytochrome c reductase cytochrome b subunit